MDSTNAIPRGRSPRMTPLWVISLFLTLTEVVTGIAVTQADGVVQAALTTFVILFPLLVAGAFFLILWFRPYVLYPPTEFGDQVDPERFVKAMQRRVTPPRVSEFDEELLEQDEPIEEEGEEPDEEAPPDEAPPGGPAVRGPDDRPPSSSPAPGITNTRGWSDGRIREALERVKVERLDWSNTTGTARKWWLAFEEENKDRIAVVYRLAEELAVRGASITEFFLAYVYSNTDNIQANLHYLDYTRLKKVEEKRKLEASTSEKPAEAPAA